MTIPLADILIMTATVFLNIVQWLIIIRIFMSFLAPGVGGQFASYIYGVTEPILGIFRSLPLRIGMFDLAPLAAIMSLELARFIIVGLITQYLA